MNRPVATTTDVVLVGGGHAHVQVLQSFAMRPPPGVRTTLVVDTPIAVYSGMVPGYVAGQYDRHELEIDVLPLARLAGARVILARAVGIDPETRSIQLDDRPPVRYDLVSFDIGSTVAGLDVPGVAEHSLTTRPIGRFVAELDERLAAVRDRPEARVSVVGAGAAGVELAFTIGQRLGDPSRVTLIEAGPTVLPGYPQALAARVTAEAVARRMELLTGRVVESVGLDSVRADGVELPSALTVWVAGAAPQDGFDPGDLPVDDDGFVRTETTLQVEGNERVFAVGDCATLSAASWVPKAGVYAVRQGPVLTENLRRITDDRPLKRYRPQRDFLTLLNLGDGTAAGAKWGMVRRGPGQMRLKDRIDRRFMDRFTVLARDDTVAPAFRGPVGMRAEMDMHCGGCAAKLGQTALDRALARVATSTHALERGSGGVQIEVGADAGDDAAVVRTAEGTRVVSSVDQFRPITDDPWLAGRIGAINAASDVLAKGVIVRHAQALISLPETAGEDEREDLLFQIMDGASRAFADLGATVLGGHTTTTSDLLVGFHVEGYAGADQPLMTVDGLRPGLVLVLTKPLGTGVLFRADMLGRARGRWLEAAIGSMLADNAAAARIVSAAGAAAATDVTGFGLARHLSGMLEASDVGGLIDVASLPTLPGTEPLLAEGVRSTAHEQNAIGSRGIAFEVGAEKHPLAPLLFDPQTSGGLLVGLPPDAVVDVLRALRDAGYQDPAVIGRTQAPSGARLRVTADTTAVSDLAV